MASVSRKSRSPYWFARYMGPLGKPVMKTTEETNKSAAMRIAQTWEDAATLARKGELTKARSMKIHETLMEMLGDYSKTQGVAEYLRGWLASRETTGRSGSTVKRYKPIIDGFISYLPEIRHTASVGSITPLDIEGFRDAELADGKGGSTANFAIKVLRAAFGAAQRKGLALSNPAGAADLVEAHAEERIPLTDEEIRKILAVTEGDWTGAILFGSLAGMRLGDVAGLTWQCIDLEKRTATIQPQKARETASISKRTLTVALHQEIVEWLATRETAIGAAPIFPSLYGKKPGSAGGLSNMFAALMQKAKIKQVLGAEKKGKGRRFRGKGFHSLRHAFISRLAAADVTADVRKIMAGHSSDEIHNRYVHLDVSAQERALAKLPRLQTA